MENKDEGNESTENGENPGSYLKPVRIQVDIKNNLGFRFFLSEIQTFFISFIWVYGARFVSIYLYKTFFFFVNSPKMYKGLMNGVFPHQIKHIFHFS